MAQVASAEMFNNRGEESIGNGKVEEIIGTTPVFGIGLAQF